MFTNVYLSLSQGENRVQPNYFVGKNNVQPYSFLGSKACFCC
jgi:hypothetical protein